MKKAIALALVLVLSFALTIPAFAAPAGSFLWDDFTNRDPKNKPELGPNGMNIWWDNWANMRASVEGNVAQIEFRPKAYDKEDYDTIEEYYDAAGDWMGNWGEAVNMWALDGIQWCKYLTIRIKGSAGGEESKLIMDWHPEDGKFFSARFSDLVLKDGSKAKITKDWQDLTIDLEKSGFPGMTNALHIRAFEGCTIFLDELYFSEGVGAIDTTSADTILGGMTVKESGKPASLPIRSYIEGGKVGTATTNPKTGDDASIFFAVIVLLLSGTGAFIALKLRKVKE